MNFVNIHSCMYVNFILRQKTVSQLPDALSTMGAFNKNLMEKREVMESIFYRTRNIVFTNHFLNNRIVSEICYSHLHITTLKCPFQQC